MSYLPLDAVFKRKKLEQQRESLIKFPDKRRFRARMGFEESLQKSIISEMSSYGVPSADIPRMLREFKKIKYYQTLNVPLFLEAHNYFVAERNEDFSLVVENFDYDFKQILKSIDPTAELTIAGSYRRKCKDSGDIDVLLKTPSVKNSRIYKNYCYQKKHLLFLLLLQLLLLNHLILLIIFLLLLFLDLYH